jgi:dienelactone hydrolase
MRTILACLLLSAARDGEQDNKPDNVRPIPPPGVAVPDADRAELTKGLDELAKEIAGLKGDLVPDVQVFHKAVDWALRYNEIFSVKEIPVAKKILAEGLARARQLKEGKPAWTTATGLVPRAYVSRIDGSVQPYGLVVPAGYTPQKKHRLDTWFHGRGETLSELNFLDQRLRSPGEFTPKDALVLHLYGRYCNANKLAGEIDLFEALEDVKKRYSIDEDRIVVRGFSMGGAACWQFAVHYPDRWVAAAPGAGFSETPDFLKVFQNETLKPGPIEQTLWHLYDCTDYAVNLFNLPTVAYSGEIDRQKQAADMMAAAMKKEGLELVHVIGPKTAHKYEPMAREEINRRIDAIAEKGRNRAPREIRFATWTLRYNTMHWLQVDHLAEHWKQARVTGQLVEPDTIRLKTENVRGITLRFAPGTAPFAPSLRPRIVWNDRMHPSTSPVAADKSWEQTIEPTLEGPLHKRHGLQGPIDDAFLDSFLIVKPTGTPLNDKVGAWAKAEMERAIKEWRRHYRGDARVTTDEALTEADIAAHNIVLWGDPSSNKVLARIADRLPLRWDARGVTAKETHAADTHVAILVYPNPLNPKRYVVLNSGFTFREYDYLNNARQVPKLPDWAVVDVTAPPSSRWPGKIVAQDFFNEEWKLK